MSLLIKNVGMPTDRPLWIVVHSDGTVEANEVSPSRPVGWQTLRNAAVPVPSHGDLIDRDALEKDISESVVFSGRDKTEIYGANKIINRLHHAPTVIEADGGDAQ